MFPEKWEGQKVEQKAREEQRWENLETKVKGEAKTRNGEEGNHMWQKIYCPPVFKKEQFENQGQDPKWNSRKVINQQYIWKYL